MEPKESGKCSAVVKDNATGQNRRCKNSVPNGQILCYRHQNQIPYFANSALPPAPPDSAKTILQTALNLPLANSALRPVTPDSAKMSLQTFLNSLPPTPPDSKKTSPQTATSTRPSTPPHSVKTDLQANGPTPYKANQKSDSNANLSTRREVFCANLEGLDRVRVGCKAKIDSLFEELEGAADAWGDLEKMVQLLFESDAWKKWDEEMGQTYNPKESLQSQEKFYDVLQEAQSILAKNTIVPQLCSFRNIRRENIGFNAPHNEQERLKSLKPDIAVVKNEHLDSDPMAFAQFLCLIEHKRGIKALNNRDEIQNSLIRSLQTFNDDFLRQYLYSVFVAGTKLRLYHLSRAGIQYPKDDLDIKDNPEMFLKFVAWLLYASPEMLGQGNPLDKIGEVPIQCEWNKPSRRPIAEVLDSRGTTVWEVRDPKPESTGLNENFAQLSLNSKAPRILKMQWAYEVRKTTEADFLRDLKDMPGVPKLIAEHRGAKTEDFSGPNDDSERIPLIGRSGQSTSTSAGSYETNISSFDYIQAQSTIPPPTCNNFSREQCWILISYCGASIDDTMDRVIHSEPFTTVQRIRALRSIIHIIRDLFCREKRIVHRDISATNIRIAPQEESDSKPTIDSEISTDGEALADGKHSAKCEPPAGNLIDFDMASYWDAQGSGAKSRTGTPIYMAAKVLTSANPACHLPWYDIESVFWVLLIGEAKWSGEVAIEIPAGIDLKTLGEKKERLIASTDAWFDLKDKKFMHGPVGKLLCQLRRFLFHKWELTDKPDDFIVPEFSYKAKRFGTQEEKDPKQFAENIANALKEGVARIDAWFEECIKELEVE